VEFAKRNNVVLVLKGHGTIVTDGQQLSVNQTGNSGMATGGCGDVLTGLIASLLAQKLPAFEAARLGVHVHGMAGDLAAEELSKPGLIASDLLRRIGRAWCEMGV
jgi:NAD(P)H-hydrate epimerase